MQEEGYQAALACDGEVHNDVRIKVEPCKSAGLKKPQKAFSQAAAATVAAEPAAKPAGPAPKVHSPVPSKSCKVPSIVRIKVEPCKSAGLKKPQKAGPKANLEDEAAEPAAAKPAGPAPKA